MRTVNPYWLFLLLMCSFGTGAMPASFDQGSYQQILQQKQQGSFIMVLWSLDCPPCMEELPLLTAFHKQNPAVDIIMVSTDEPSRGEEIVGVMKQNRLLDISHWVFETSQEQRIRYSIDPQWYGELPRSYFYLAGKRVAAISGRLKKTDLDKWLEASSKEKAKS
ncbi:MAG: TlpA family protein disulfide reductase [Gammaproteobacteria bacterium]|nr:TlpA family protein disulfide reductase [Gammaproteobacteria bacterium]